MESALLGPTYQFAAMRFHPLAHALWRGDERLPLGSRASALLELLVSNAGARVAAHELHEAAWPGLHIEASNLRAQIYRLRRLLGPSPDGGEMIVADPQGGYRLLGEVRIVQPDMAAGEAELAGPQCARSI